MNLKNSVILGLLIAGMLSLHAQPVNVQQFQNLQQAQQFQQPLTGILAATNAPELYPGENADVGPQHILRRNPRPVYFNVFFDSQVFYSDNANFAEGSAIVHSAVFVNTVQPAFTPPAWELGPGKFALVAGYVSQWYNYGNNRIASLDFNAQTAFVSGRYTVDNWQFGFGGNYTRLLDQGSYAQTYAEWLPALTAQRFFPISDKVIISLGNQVDYHFTSVPSSPGATCTEINNRFDEAVSLTVSCQITRQLNLQPYYSFQYSNYRYNTFQTSDRNDYLNSFGFTLTYAFNQNFSVRGFCNGNLKHSDNSVPSNYREYNAGVGATANFNF